MVCYSCPAIDNFHLNFYGRIDTEEPAVALCCEGGLGSRPAIPMQANAEETLDAFLDLRDAVISENVSSGGGFMHSRARCATDTAMESTTLTV